MKDVVGYEGLYAVTSCGKVWSYKRQKFLSPGLNHRGYLQVILYKDGKSKSFRVHKLVAEAYIPNPQNLETVDHIDEYKTHNYVSNLRWLSRGENKSRSWSKSVRCIETGQIFESVTIAAKEMGLDQGNISNVCNGKYKTTKGFHFEFVKECDD